MNIYCILTDGLFLQMLTGGLLLLRNKYFIVMYRGKDFLPPSVAAALTERQEMTKQSQNVEEEVRIKPTDTAPVSEDGQVLAGTLAEFYESQARWGREISSEEREKMIQEASREKTARVVKKLEHKLALVSPSFHSGNYLFLRMPLFISNFRTHITLWGFCFMITRQTKIGVKF